MQRKVHTKQQINVNLKVLKSSLCTTGQLAQPTCNAYILLIMGLLWTKLRPQDSNSRLHCGRGLEIHFHIQTVCVGFRDMCALFQSLWVSIFAQRYVQSGLVRNLLNSKFVVFSWIFAILTMAWHWSLRHGKAYCYVWLSKSQSDWQAQSTGTCFFSMENAHMLHPLVNMDHDWLQCLYISKVYNLTPIYWLSVMHFSMRICTNRVGATPIAARFS